MNRFRIFFDFEMNRPLATIYTPERYPLTLDLSRIRSVTSTDVHIYDDNHVSQLATVAKSCYDISGISLTEEVFQRETNLFPLHRFECLSCTSLSDLQQQENANPRYFYTEGGTRFQFYYGESTTQLFYGISSANMYTQGEDADVYGFQNIPIRDSGAYALYAGNSVGITQFGIISKTNYKRETFKIQFVSNKVLFAGDENARQIVLCVPNIQPTNSDTPVIPFECRIKAYTTDVFEGVKDIVPEYLPTDNNVSRGGSGNGAYPFGNAEGFTDFAGLVSTRNAALSNTMGTGNGLTYYQVTANGFRNCLSFAYSHDGIVEGWKAESRQAAFVGAYMLPIPIQTVQASAFYLADDARAFLVFSNREGYLTNRLVRRSFGSVDFSSYGWDDFNDFQNTRASLFLPFVGRIEIDINAIARGAIYLESIIDITNGNICYWVYTQSMQAPIPILYGTYSGNCAIQVPVTGVYTGNVLNKIVNAGSQIASGNVFGLINTAIDMQTDVRVSRNGAVDTSSAAVGALQPRIDIERKEMLRAENMQDISGIPAYATMKLSDCSGFVQVIDGDFSGLQCEEAEKAEIERLLKEGVFI